MGTVGVLKEESGRETEGEDKRPVELGEGLKIIVEVQLLRVRM